MKQENIKIMCWGKKTCDKRHSKNSPIYDVLINLSCHGIPMAGHGAPWHVKMSPALRK